MKESYPSSFSRRALIAGAAATTLAATPSPWASGSEKNGTIRLGMIGCGGRGNWIANHFAQHGSYSFTACADYFPDRASSFGKKFGIPQERCYATMSAYKRLLESDVDAVVIESPAFLHPEHASASVDAGKHVFLAKPVAVDVPGCATVSDAGRRATEKRLVFLVDFQTRNDPLFREAAKRVLYGDIGRIVAGQADNHAGGPRDMKWDESDDETRLRHWGKYRAMCGDFIVEQAIHALDMATWFIDADPVSAYGRGGRPTRKGSGDNYDHFVVTYRFPDDVLLDFFGTQVTRDIPGGYEITARLFGSQGFVDTYYNKQVVVRGPAPFKGGMTTDLYTKGAVANIKDFHDFISSGMVANPTVAPTIRSNLTSILGREAAYAGGEVSLAKIMKEAIPMDTGLKTLKGM